MLTEYLFFDKISQSGPTAVRLSLIALVTSNQTEVLCKPQTRPYIGHVLSLAVRT